MTTLNTALAWLGGVLSGGFVGAMAHYAVRSLGQRHRDEVSGLQAQRQAVHHHARRVYEAREWVAGLPQSVDGPHSPEGRQALQAEAIRRSDECHATWETVQRDIDSDEVRAAMATLDEEVVSVLRQVAKGNFSPDLDPLVASFDELAAAAKHRLTTDLSPRPAKVATVFRGRRG
ncbi:hypothetical protein AQJ66_06790 [Streptomyces bungoensis]|uniref:Uncharacterized protein n=1 Tax=Streptomyces bungoensis TaxID=285568 RepID=A0A101TA64_9ACTN|nr:hypothetical protein [Streptomyces bungoensis]KUN88542.1 hypothetical protein AQJ66_06790 [Streptomyces bungoensis]